jgi:hypothetical protein
VEKLDFLTHLQKRMKIGKSNIYAHTRAMCPNLRLQRGADVIAGGMEACLHPTPEMHVVCVLGGNGVLVATFGSCNSRPELLSTAKSTERKRRWWVLSMTYSTEPEVSR